MTRSYPHSLYDYCPEFVLTEYHITINENLPFNQNIVQVKDDEKRLYAVWQGKEGKAFIIDRQIMLIYDKIGIFEGL